MKRLPLAGIALLLGACTTLGPDFTAPEPGWDRDWQSPSLAAVPTIAGADPWWQQFDDPALSALIAAADAGNNNLKIAGLRILEARAQLAVARALRSPQVTVGTAGAGYAASARRGAAIGDSDFLFADAGIQAGWEIDFWGRFKRAIESADAAYFASVAARQDASLLIRSEVGRLYLAHRILQERLAVAQENVGLQSRSVAITELLFRNGAEAELDLQQARTQLLSTRAGIPSLELGIVQTRNALALLVGRPPGPLPELALSPPRMPTMPAALAADIPADLLRRRPDVRAAGWRAGAQSAQIGIARADLYPSLTLGGSIGLTRTTGGIGNAVDIGVGPAIRWNVLDLGRIRGNVRVQDARLQQALTVYQDTVLQAATEVDNAAVAFTKKREEDELLAASETAARRSLALATLRYGEGMSDFQRVLDAQAALLRQQDRRVINRADIANSLVQLHKAIGGGWSVPSENDLADPATRATMKARTDWGKLLDMLDAKP